MIGSNGRNAKGSMMQRFMSAISGKPKRRRSGGSGNVSSEFQILEERRVLTSGVTAVLSNGVLQVNGTEGNDTIIFRQASGRISIDGVQIRGSGYINQIRVNAGGGNE